MTALLFGARKSLDTLVDGLAALPMTLSEAELLQSSCWELGQDTRAREDFRLRQTPWARWMRGQDLLANEALYHRLTREQCGVAHLGQALSELQEQRDRRHVFCPADPRFVLDGDEVRLSASELSDRPAIEDNIGELEKYTTHLPLHSLKAAAASLPLGEWGARAQDEVVETTGWVGVSLGPDRRLNPKMFVARVLGHSMEDGRSGLEHGAYVVFEFDEADPHPLRPVVLVRGSFDHPETGSYALKKFIGEPTSDEGGHEAIALRSLNPDRSRYPDILWTQREEDAIRLVAQALGPLARYQFARKPKPSVRGRRRDLKSQDGIERIERRLTSEMDSFFEAAPAVPHDGASPNVDQWQSQLVCLEAEAGALQLEVGPLVGLWKFIKILLATSDGGRTSRILGANARLRQVRVPVAAVEGGWSWVAEGFEDDLDVDLSTLQVSGLATDQATVFRVDADGVGRPMAGTRLSPGQHYRAIVPEAAWNASGTGWSVTTLSDGWRLVEIALPESPSAELREAIRSLGLQLGSPAPSLTLGLASWPDEWRANSRGRPFPAFHAGPGPTGSTLLVDARDYHADLDGDAWLFLHGPQASSRLALPAGGSATLELGDLAVGRYLCSILHQNARIQVTHLPFEVSTSVARPPSAGWSLRVADTQVASSPGGLTELWRGDLSAFDGEAGKARDTQELELSGPPGWPVSLVWRELGTKYLTTLPIGEAGLLDVSPLLRVTRERRSRRLVGDLLLNLRELGITGLEHARSAPVEEVGDELWALMTAQGPRLERLAGSYVELHRVWFRPLTTCLGYHLEELQPEMDACPVEHVATARLLVDKRRPGGISRRCRRVLVMMEDVTASPDESILIWLDRVCERNEVDALFVSNGTLWTERSEANWLPAKVWDLRSVFANRDSTGKFLATFGGRIR